MPPAAPICTRCRLRSILRDFRLVRSSRSSSGTVPARGYADAAAAASLRSPNPLSSARAGWWWSPARFLPGSRLARPSSPLLLRHRGFAIAGSPLLLRAGERRLKRRRRGNVAEEAEGEEAGDGGENAMEMPAQQQLQIMEFLFVNGDISWAEWRTAVFAQIGVEDEMASSEDERVVDERVRRVRQGYGAELAIPAALLDEKEKKVWERLFGSDSLRELEESEVDDIGADEEGGTVVMREGKDGLEEVEYEEDEEEPVRKRYVTGDERLAEDIQDAMSREDGLREEGQDVYDEDERGLRTHPLSIANRFGTNPSTLQLSQSDIVDPVSAILAGISPVHIAETANRIFGGSGLPYSTSTPHRGKLMQQKPIPLDASQSQMSPIEGDVYMATLVPGIYASVMSVLTETRKRLGTAWAEQLVRKANAGELKILDAGGGGAGVLAVREVLRAEWERMHEENSESPVALVEADGRVGGPGASPPLGSATVLTSSDVLRRRASQLLENTTFIPRLPDYVHTEEAKLHGKFDIVIAPHTLWQLKEDYIRKVHVQNLWSLLSSSGGVLLMLEKGIPRGFELIAGAREMLLNTRIATPNAAEDVEPVGINEVAKEPGMIIAPCTNHSSCPMYQQKGIVKGRRDICSFGQRYHRPPFLQKIFGTRGRNHDDVEFSYLSMMRGQDLREENKYSSAVIQQDAEATDRAFQGYEVAASLSKSNPTQDDPTLTSIPHSLSLPRAVFPPLKRKGHVILDVCTPAGTLERWTVPRSFSKQAFRDARKSAWGDLWAMGAKTRVPRNIKAGAAKADMDVEGYVVTGEVRKGRKAKGIRDKRDKKGAGNGRKKYQEEA